MAGTAVSRIVNRMVAVATGRHGRPLAYQRERRWLHVAEVLEEWIYREPWWERSFLDERPGEAPERAFYRVRLEGGGVVELLRRSEDGTWRLYRAFD